ncbi:MAG: RHS repeat protein, partial [Clostridia bacterium]|nr:RHS repeat protein [Clostridia bacterium]
MKNRIRLTVKMLAFVMSVLILIASLPVSSIASAIYNDTGDTNDTSTENTSENADIQSEQKPKDVIVLEEDEALREENIKHFKLSDGTTKAVVYTQPVHYKDSNGKWIDIDNALTLNGSEYSTNNKSEIKFANKSGSSGLVSIKDGKYKIDFTPSNTNKVSVVIENPQSNNSRKFEDLSVLNNLVSKAIYTNIYDGIDIEYVLVGNNIKENIIVKEKQDSYTYTFELKLNNLSAELVNGAIILSDYDSDEQVYEIPAPYMLDANNEYSNSVEYSLVQNSKWKYTLTVTANPEWINAEERVFPVTIDPTIRVSDSYITGYTNIASNTTSTLTVGNGNKAYIQLNALPTLPNDSFVVSAILKLFATSAGGNYVGIYQGEYTSIKDFNEITTATEYQWEISEILNSWYIGGASSGSLRLESVSGSGTSEFYLTDNNDNTEPSTYRPKIVITYMDIKGIEPYWSYISQNAGIAGTGNININTGDLVFSVPTLTTTDSLFGFTPTLIYNSTLAGQDYIFANAQVSYIGAYAPKGFKFNGHETLMKSTHLDTDGTSKAYYVWTDGDGTEHYFYESGQNTNVYIDEDGLQCTLRIVSNNEAQLTDANHNVRTFEYLNPMFLNNVTEAWYLTSISDKNNNKLSFVLNNDKNPTAINLTPNGQNPIEMLTIEYSDSLRINLVWNKTSGEARLLRYSDTPTGELSATGGAYLREMLFLHCDNTVTSEMLQAFVGDTDNVASGITVDAVATYEYDSDGYLIKATDNLSDYSIEYTIGYYSKLINEVQEYGKNQTQGQSIGLTYYKNYTKVIYSGSDDVLATNDDLVNIYYFDNSGRTLSTYTIDSTGAKVYGAVTGEYSNVEKAKNSLAMSTVVNGNSANYAYNGNFEWDSSSAKYWTLSSNARFCVSDPGVDWDNSYLELSVFANETASAEQNVFLANGTYTVSFDIKAYETSNLTICFEVASETYSYIERIPVNEIYASGNGFFISSAFEIPQVGDDATGYTMGIYLEGNSLIENEESIKIDNVMLAKTTGASSYNYVNFGDAQFQVYDLDDTNGWQSRLTQVDEGHGRSLYVEGTINYEASVYQTIYTAPQSLIDQYLDPINGGGFATSQDRIFTLSGFAKADSAIPSNKSTFALNLNISYYSAGELKGEPILAKFNPGYAGWQFSTVTFVLPTGSFIKEIKVECEYSHNIGTAYFDDISLTCDTDSQTTTYEYYGDGKLKAKVSGANNITFYTYDENDVTNVITNRTKDTYQYDSNHNVISVTSYSHNENIEYGNNNWNVDSAFENKQVLKSTTMYNYNAYGMLSQEVTRGSANDEYVYTGYTYNVSAGSKIFGALTCTTNGFNKKTQYFYNENNGQLIASIEPDNNGYYYTYNDFGNLISVYPAKYSTALQKITNSANVHYEYDVNNRLSKIIIGDMEYRFTYDEFGNQSSVSVGNSSSALSIASQERNAYNGKVTKITYANGTVISYEYDDLSRMVKKTYSTGTESIVYEYEYDSNGNLCKVIDGKSETITVYKYDHTNKLTKMIEYDSNEYVNNYSLKYHYDNKDRFAGMLYSQDYQCGTNSYDKLDVSYSYAYKSGSDSLLEYLRLLVENDMIYDIDYIYDDFRRYSSKTVAVGNIDNVISFDYVSANKVTSSLVSSYTTQIKTDTETISSQTFSYTYDAANQNITEIRNASGNLLYRYTYDSLDRLVREDNSVTNKTHLYTYDNNGNITNEVIFVYTLGDAYDSTFVESYLWTYANSQWGDQLTNYNGGNIYYDSMGNPTRYYNGLEFTWDNVNNLASISDGWLINTYTYNDQGIRTSKTVNGVTHTYHL